METFTLIIWLYAGMRFEEAQIPNMDRGECVELYMKISGDRGKRDDKGYCLGTKGTIAPRLFEPDPKCASCGWDLPGRRRV